MKSLMSYMVPVGLVFHRLKEEIIKALKAESGYNVWVENHGEDGDETHFVGELRGEEIHLPTAYGTIPKKIYFFIRAPKNSIVGINRNDDYVLPQESNGESRLFMSDGLVIRVISDFHTGDTEIRADEISGTVVRNGRTYLLLEERKFEVTIKKDIPRTKENIDRFLSNPKLECPYEIKMAILALKFPEEKKAPEKKKQEVEQQTPSPNGINLPSANKDQGKVAAIKDESVAKSSDISEEEAQDKAGREAAILAAQGGNHGGSTSKKKKSFLGIFKGKQQ